jgi:hypothetical protein
MIKEQLKLIMTNEQQKEEKLRKRKKEYGRTEALQVILTTFHNGC